MAFLSLAGLSFAQKKGIKFEQGQNWEQIKTKAKLENKYIFVDMFATWCGPCKAMDEEIYPNEQLGEFMNERFISVKMQTDSSKNDNNQIKLWYPIVRQMLKEYSVKAYPTYLFFDPNGVAVHKFVGQLDDTTFKKVALSALDPKKQYYTLLKAYCKKALDYRQMPGLSRISKYLGEDAESKQIAKDYIDNYLLKLKDEVLFTKDNLTFIAQNLGNSDSGTFRLFLAKSDKVNSVLGNNKVEYAIRSAISKEYLRGIEPSAKPNFDWTALKRTIVVKFGPIGLETLYGAQMIYYLNAKDWANFGKYYILYFGKALKRPEYTVNNISWALFGNVTDKKVLDFACDSVMKYAMEEWYQTDPAAYDTYANLLYKAGRNVEAIAWQEKAVKIAKGTSYEKENQGHLEKMLRNEKTWSETSNNP